jgi:hypothetical protein
MPFPTANYTSQGVAQAAIVGRLHGNTINNVFWFSRPGELGTPDWPAILAALGVAILDCAITHLLPGLSSQYSLESIRCTLMSDANKQQHITSAPANSVGALGESLPSFVAATATFYTPYIGDTRRGGMRVAGIPEANQALGVMSGTPNAALLAFFNCMLGKFKWDTGTEAWDWIVYSRKLGYTPPSTYSPNINNYAPITQVVLRTNLGSQNSRKNARGI